MKPANTVLGEYGTTVFEVMSRLAMEHGSINLGQGFPDSNGPDDVRAKAAEFVESGPNQYPPMLGVAALREAVSAHAARFYGLDYDWRSEVMVTSGATESLAACILGLINPGDEAVAIEPCYDSYLPMLRRAGARVNTVRLEPPDWALPETRLAAAFSDRTKLVLLNNPMNPTGKVFSRDELSLIAALCARHDTLALCDEVYEHITFDGVEFVPLATLPGMRERSLRIGSAGKTFSLTGWKVGYTSADSHLLSPVAKAHQFITFTTAPNLQRAVAYGLAKDASYFDSLKREMQHKRDLFKRGLERVGFEAAVCDGTYFINANFRPLGFTGDDEAFCRHITLTAGVTAVPVSAFYLGGTAGGAPANFTRFCFCKQDAVLEEAIVRLDACFNG